jgi:hypothetical protein
VGKTQQRKQKRKKPSRGNKKEKTQQRKQKRKIPSK